MSPVEHAPTSGCVDIHCYSCGVDEAGPVWLRCFECGHVYRSRRALRRDYRAAMWRATARSAEFGAGEALWRRLWRVLTVRASRITFCQHCIHDF